MPSMMYGVGMQPSATLQDMRKKLAQEELQRRGVSFSDMRPLGEVANTTMNSLQGRQPASYNPQANQRSYDKQQAFVQNLLSLGLPEDKVNEAMQLIQGL